MDKELKDDQELIQELNETYGDEEDIDEDVRKRRSHHWFLRLASFIVVAVFLGYALNYWFSLWKWPFEVIEQQHAELAGDPMVEELQKSVVRLKAFTSEGERNGTGFNIREDGLIVTNRHLVEGAHVIAVSFLEEGGFQAVHWSYSQEYDLAVLELEAEGLPFVQFQEESSMDTGEELIVIGNPLSYRRTASRGNLQGYVNNREGNRVLLVSIPVFPGSSGSPVFNKQKEVVGVIYAYVSPNSDENAFLSLAVPAPQIITLLED